MILTNIVTRSRSRTHTLTNRK